MPANTLRKASSLSLLFAFFFLAGTKPAHAQLNEVMRRVFEEILVNRVVRTSGPHGNHQGNHFLTSADVANSKLAPALNSFIANNVTSFPIPTMVPNMTFSMSGGSPVAKTTGLGPIFAEPAETMGKGVINLGVSFSHLNFAKVRGVPVSAMRFAFTHRDLTGDGTLGDFAPESDVFNIDLDMDINASITAVVATFGVTNALDFGVAVPLLATSFQGNAHATVQSFTLAHLGAAVHRFGGDDANPILETTVPFQETATGLGDVALRMKYNFLQKLNMNAAALLEMRLPTGSRDDFMGTGETKFKLALLSEHRIGGFAPHANLAFGRRTSDLNNDRIEFKAGFEQRIAEGLSLAVDLMGTHDVSSTETVTFPGSAVIYDRIDNAVKARVVKLSNIPARSHDNIIDGSVGFKFAPSSRLAMLGNLLIPLNDGGLRASFVPTIGASMNY